MEGIRYLRTYRMEASVVRIISDCSFHILSISRSYFCANFPDVNRTVEKSSLLELNAVSDIPTVVCYTEYAVCDICLRVNQPWYSAVATRVSQRTQRNDSNTEF